MTTVTPLVTVLVPTHAHHSTLPYSVGSALTQTLDSLEVFIVGDGPGDAVRDAAHGLAASDPRVRYFENPKGERHGERHRHAALQEARGCHVLYLSDDDIWLPEHAALVVELLEEGHDFVCGTSIRVRADGSLSGVYTDLSNPKSLEAVRQRRISMALSVGGHTLEAYRRLPEGWRPAPGDVYTDLWMWLQFLEQPWCRAATLLQPTVVLLPSAMPERGALDAADRAREVAAYAEHARDPEWRRAYERAVLRNALRDASEYWAQFDATYTTLLACDEQRRDAARQVGELDELARDAGDRAAGADARAAAAHQAVADADARAAAAHQAVAVADARAAAAEAALRVVEGSLAWRVAERVRRHARVTRMARRLVR